MKGVSKRVAKVFAPCAVVLLLGAQPVLAAPKGPSGDRGSQSILRTIINRILDLTDISFPPG
jgi:hypothetical protein